jgi:ATP-dependent DNA helicase RecQ
MVLSAIYKTQQNFGKNYIIDILRGSSEQKILANKADQLSMYGIGTFRTKKEWFVIIERLLELNIITLGDFHTLHLTQDAIAILKSQKMVDIKASRLELDTKKKVTKQQESFEYDKELFELLRKKRTELASEHGVPAYIILSDKTLKHMANEMPTTKEHMLDINGIGEKKFKQFGEDFLELIVQYGTNH